MTPSLPIQVIIPKESELQVENELQCTEEGCGKTFQSSSSYRMHYSRHHKGVCLEPVAPGNQVKKLYYCPVEGCNRSSIGKPFPRLGQLKQHYNTVHATKSFTCHNCGRGFGLKDAHSRHVKECGRVFKCESCDLTFRSSNALYQHNKRTHRIKKKTSPLATPTKTTPTIVIRPIIKNVLPIPKISQKSSQTSNSPPKEKSGDNLEEVDISDFSGEFLELGTQTDISCDNFLFSSSLFPSSHSTDHSVQTNTVSSCEFGTQTFYSTNSLSTSTHDWSEALPRPLLDVRSHDLPPLVDEFLNFNNGIDFGTQTLNDFANKDEREERDFVTTMSRITRDQESQT